MNRLLIIDDEQDVLSMLQDMFSSLGHQVHCAQEAEEAEALLNHFSYDLIITDLALTPVGLSGFELLGRMCACEPRPKVLVLSGHAESAIRSEAHVKGVDAFLEKPQSLRDLARVASTLLGGEA